MKGGDEEKRKQMKNEKESWIDNLLSLLSSWVGSAIVGEQFIILRRNFLRFLVSG